MFIRVLKVVVAFNLALTLPVSAAINKKGHKQFQKLSDELSKKRLDRQNQSLKYRARSNNQRRQNPNTQKPSAQKKKNPVTRGPSYDIPVIYNSKVKKWIKYYQSTGRRWFKNRLERSHKYLPIMRRALARKKLPQDLAYISLIESGFSAHATSHAAAVGYWQFIAPTAKRYGLKKYWWLDERRDFVKSTKAASSYLSDLYRMFGSWYLAASAYNMGENRLRRLIRQHKTKNFWVLSQKRNFPKETRDYIPKLVAAVIIAKSPKLYGFRRTQPMKPYSYEYFNVPGGTDIHGLARYLGVPKKQLKRFNPELIVGLVPKFVRSHQIRIPKGRMKSVATYINRKRL